MHSLFDNMLSYCPKCFKEYEEVYTFCPICRTKTLDKKPDKKDRANLSKEEVTILLDELRNSLPNNLTATYDFYKHPFQIREEMIYNSNIVHLLQKIADNMCGYLNISENAKVYYVEEGLDRFSNLDKVFTCNPDGTVHKLEKEKEYAGLYNNEKGIMSIILVKKRGYKLKHLLGILAHEITHHFLIFHRITKKNEIENEILTDIAAVFWGFGHILLPAYKTISYNTDYENDGDSYSYVQHDSTIGYVTPETILRTISITCEVKKWNPTEIINEIESGFDRSSIMRKLLPYRIRLFKIRLSQLFSKFLLETPDRKILRVQNKLGKISEKFKKLRNHLGKVQKFNLNNMNLKDSQALVEISNDLQLGITEYEIKNLKIILTDISNGKKQLNNEIYSKLNKLDQIIAFRLSLLKKIEKSY